MARQGRVENLKPVQPGEVRNPEGRNQYSYRRDFEATVDSLLRSVYEFAPEELEPGEGEMARCLVCNLFGCDTRAGLNIYAHQDCLCELDGKTRGEVIGLVAVQRALAGDNKMLSEILKRVWPASKPGDHQVLGGERVKFEWKESISFVELAKRAGSEIGADSKQASCARDSDNDRSGS